MSKEEKTQSLDEFKGWLRGHLGHAQHLERNGILEILAELDRVVVPAQYSPPGGYYYTLRGQKQGKKQYLGQNQGSQKKETKND